ncbi:MAG: 23S rRNA (adenine(2503)-C(2))-methyltransferase RlmN, partial [Planctomycetota bacterium]
MACAPARPHLASLALEALAGRLDAWGEPGYRAAQIFEAVHARGVLDPARMTTLPAPLRARLAEGTRPAATEVVETATSADDTVKLLLALEDGRRIETVLIPEGSRRTVCVSTQVGCPMGCIFCASGVGGLLRNLETAEIVEQVLHVRGRLDVRPTHVVVMGMGEPLLNLDALTRAIALWRHPRGLHLSPRRITVSTASTAALIRRFGDAGLGVNLAVSLHAPDDAIRQRLVPTSRPGRTRELVRAAREEARRSGRDATVEYVLIAGLNDRPPHARALGALLRGGHVHVNLIPLNPVGHRPDLRAPTAGSAGTFARTLRAAGVSVTLRTRRGESIHAACGQVALERTGAPE